MVVGCLSDGSTESGEVWWLQADSHDTFQIIDNEINFRAAGALTSKSWSGT